MPCSGGAGRTPPKPVAAAAAVAPGAAAVTEAAAMVAAEMGEVVRVDRAAVVADLAG